MGSKFIWIPDGGVATAIVQNVIKEYRVFTYHHVISAYVVSACLKYDEMGCLLVLSQSETATFFRNMKILLCEIWVTWENETCA